MGKFRCTWHRTLPISICLDGKAQYFPVDADADKTGTRYGIKEQVGEITLTVLSETALWHHGKNGGNARWLLNSARNVNRLIRGASAITTTRVNALKPLM